MLLIEQNQLMHKIMPTVILQMKDQTESMLQQTVASPRISNNASARADRGALSSLNAAPKDIVLNVDRIFSKDLLDIIIKMNLDDKS